VVHVKRWKMMLGLVILLAPEARGQAVAFFPIPAVVNDGASLNVTPVATGDRRYVRLSLNATFTGVQGFSTFPVPGAVSGGPGGGLPGGGLGGLPGFGGGGAGGGGVGGGGGGRFQVGMNGVEGQVPYHEFFGQSYPFGYAQNTGQFNQAPAMAAAFGPQPGEVAPVYRPSARSLKMQAARARRAQAHVSKTRAVQ
jgi:hypothetical protein